MRRLLPEPADEDLDELYRDLDLGGPDAPRVSVGMVSSLDGRVAVGGVSGPLGGEADRRAFRALRAAADVVLVGAGTVRAEDYRAVQLPEEVQDRRTAAGRLPVPPVAVVTRSGDLDPGARLFADPRRRPIVLAPEGGAAERGDRLERLRPVADVVQVGVTDVDLAGALDLLAERGHHRVLCEGGPRLVGQLVGAGLVDELFLTLAPRLVGHGRGLLEATLSGGSVTLELRELRVHAGELLLRYGVAPTDGS